MMMINKALLNLKRGDCVSNEAQPAEISAAIRRVFILERQPTL